MSGGRQTPASAALAIMVRPEEEPTVRAFVNHLRRSAVLARRAARLQRRVDNGGGAADRAELLRVLDEMQGELARHEESLGRGPCMSAIAKAQIAILRKLDATKETM